VVYGVGIALDGCVWVFLGRMMDDGVGIALDGCVWVCMGDESFSRESLNSKLSFYILLTNLHLPLNLSVSDDRKFL
jgi:hypothetical protein